MSLWGCAEQASLSMWVPLLLRETFVSGVNSCEEGLVGLRCCNENPVKTTPHFYYWAWHYMVWDCGLEISCPAVFSCPPHLAPLHDGVRNGEILDAVRVLFGNSVNSRAITTALVTNPKQSTVGATVKKISSIPASPKCRITGGSLHARLLESSMLSCWNWVCIVHLFFFFLSYLGISQ